MEEGKMRNIDITEEISFINTLQIIDDIRIPNGNWGKASYLEPLTNDYPEFGPEGATQVITNDKIILDEITKLPK